MLAFVLIALLSGNNLAVCTGAIISGRMVSKNFGIFITIIGYITGLLLQGNLLTKGFAALLPLSSSPLIAIALGISILVFLISDILRVPQSLSIAFTMALVGVALASGNSLNVSYLLLILAFWILAPLVTVFLTMILLRYTTRKMLKTRLWKTLDAVKITLIIVSFLSAVTLGANTIGLLYASVSAYTSIWIIIGAIVIGSFLLSAGALRRIGDQIIPIRYLNALVSQALSSVLVEIATLASLPFSNTQAFTASLYGVALSYRTKLLLKQTAIVIILAWIANALLSLVLGYLIVRIF